MSVTALLVEGTIKFSIVAALALAAVVILRQHSAALRHWVLATAIAGAVVMPLLARLVPAWPLPLAPVVSNIATAPADPGSGRAVPLAAKHGQSRSAVETAEAWAIAAPIAGAMLAVGAAVNVAILLAGACRLRRIGSRARRVNDPRWVLAAADISRALGLRRRVILQQCEHPSLLVTWGIVRPRVILPRDAHAWTQDRIRIVLWHELAHVRRRDWVVQMAAELLRAIHWFNPLAWIVCARVRHESEQAADDAVLSAGITGRDYAEHLLDLARVAVRHRVASWPAPAMVRPSTLERRVANMLDTTVNRTPLTRSARFACIAALSAVAIAVASAQGALARFSGSVVDPMNRTLPNVELVLTNVQSSARHEIRSDSTGRFEFSGLPPGTYAFEVTQLGFEALTGQVTLTSHDVQQQLKLEVGTLQETITVKAGQEPREPAREQLLDEKRRQRQASVCGDTPHGGNIRPPWKIQDVRPQYPLHLGNAQVGGTVFLEARIAKDGTIKEVHVVKSAHRDLDASALAAVREWRFDSTLLNCMPIEVAMRVRVNFTP